MKYKTHDENGYPLNYNPCEFYCENEIFIDMPSHVNYIFNIDINRYMISNWGRIYDKYTGVYHPKTLTPRINKYNSIMLKDIYGNDYIIKVHRLVCAAYYGIIGIHKIGERNIVNHLDGVKWHNEPYNLEWTNDKGNIRDAFDKSLCSSVYGSENFNAKLSENQYHEICKYLQNGNSAYDINKIMDVGFDITNIIQKIKNKKTLLYISDQYDFSKCKYNDYKRFSDDDVRNICSYIENGITDADKILSNLGIYTNSLSRESRYLYRKRIRDIINKKSFVNISSEFKF